MLGTRVILTNFVIITWKYSQGRPIQIVDFNFIFHLICHIHPTHTYSSPAKLEFSYIRTCTAGESESLHTLLTHVFGERKMHKVSSETADDNVPMRSWLEKVPEAKLETKRRECWKARDNTPMSAAIAF